MRRDAMTEARNNVVAIASRLFDFFIEDMGIAREVSNIPNSRRLDIHTQTLV
jgi:hypothetical protein